MSKQEHDPWKDVLKRAMTDPAYRQALKANPAKVLAETGVKVDKATEYVVVEQTPHKVYLVLPALAGEGELSDEMLNAVAGGHGQRGGGFQGFDGDDRWPHI